MLFLIATSNLIAFLPYQLMFDSLNAISPALTVLPSLTLMMPYAFIVGSLSTVSALFVKGERRKAKRLLFILGLVFVSLFLLGLASTAMPSVQADPDVTSTTSTSYYLETITTSTEYFLSVYTTTTSTSYLLGTTTTSTSYYVSATTTSTEYFLDTITTSTQYFLTTVTTTTSTSYYLSTVTTSTQYWVTTITETSTSSATNIPGFVVTVPVKPLSIMVGAYRIKPNILPPHNVEFDLTLFNHGGKITVAYEVKDSANNVIWKDTLIISPPDGSYTVTVTFPVDKEGSYTLYGTAKSATETASFGQSFTVGFLDIYWPPMLLVAGAGVMDLMRRRRNHNHG